MNQWLTSDLHFYHKGVIEYCKRPWPNVEEMNEGLIHNWNQNVKPNDEVRVLGDFAFCGSTKIMEIVPRLNGKKILVIGNHDYKYKPERWLEFGFAEATVGPVNLGEIVLSHFPYRGQQHDERAYFEAMPEDTGAWLLHGHVHNAWKRKGRMINVGVDVWDWRPVHMGEIIALMARAY